MNTTKILILISIILLLSFLVLQKINKNTTTNKNKLIKIDTIPDNPIDFGYKINWIAVKNGDKKEIAKIIGLSNLKPSNWKNGIENAYEKSIFISPKIGNWTLIVGNELPIADHKNINKLEKILNDLSNKFEEAQYFGTNRIVEYHSWIKSENGKIKRAYSYIGEKDETIKFYGKLTEPEKELNLYNSLSDEAKLDKYWEREDLNYPDEELVMKIAENWSINPTKLTNRTDIKKELGLIGILK